MLLYVIVCHLQIFYTPLEASGIITDEELQMIFVNWSELVMCNTKFLKLVCIYQNVVHLIICSIVYCVS